MVGVSKTVLRGGNVNLGKFGGMKRKKKVAQKCRCRCEKL